MSTTNTQTNMSNQARAHLAPLTTATQQQKDVCVRLIRHHLPLKPDLSITTYQSVSSGELANASYITRYHTSLWFEPSILIAGGMVHQFEEHATPTSRPSTPAIWFGVPHLRLIYYISESGAVVEGTHR
jgi:hypothetical protein